MKIVTLRAENVKRLRAVEITPDGNTVVIAGRNAQGKSSVLDSIWLALAGAAGSKDTPRPIRDGEESASVELDLGDLRVVRRWTKSGTTLEVSAHDGARYPSPQKMLDSLIGRLTFDPLAFAHMDPRGQRQALLDVLDLDIDPDELARRRQTAFDDRTEVNRDGKRVAAQLEGIPAPPDGTPDEELSAAAIAEELREIERAESVRLNAESGKAHAERRIAALEAELADERGTLAAIVEEIAGLPAARDAEPVRARLAEVDVVNAAARAKHERAKLEAELDGLRQRSKALTDVIAAIDAERDAAIAAAKMPLDGLSFDENGVIYQGVPFEQASGAEQLRASIAVAMALNPKIRVLRITDGSLLDSENLRLIEGMAAAHDFQVWIERVDETGDVGIVIEDGQVLVAEASEEKAA